MSDWNALAAGRAAEWVKRMACCVKPSVSVTAAMLLAATAVSAAGEPVFPKGLHVPNRQSISFTRTLTDGGGYQWDIQYYGSVYRGTNYAYSGGMYCHVNGSNVRSPNSRGWMDAGGDEIEIGPYRRNNLSIWRRIKVYKDKPLARWLEILHNPTASDITVKVQIYTNTNSSVRSVVTDTGASAFGAADNAFITETSNNPSMPVLHLVCNKRAPLRPSVLISGNQIYVKYDRVSVPAGKTVLLCHFESQNRDKDAHMKLMKSFKARRYMKDLPGPVRRLILNFSAVGRRGGVDLERTASADTVIQRGDKPVFGMITNESFTVETFFGALELPAEKVLGMAVMAGSSDRVRFLLVDGQVVSGRYRGTVIMQRPDGTLRIPTEKITQWSYRISKARPEEPATSETFVELRTGDRLSFDARTARFDLRTRYGPVELHGRDLVEILMDNPDNAVHRAVFVNGSSLSGFLGPETVEMDLKLGRKLSVHRNLIGRLQFVGEASPDPMLTVAQLANGDVLVGRLTAEKLELRTDSGTLAPQVARIRRIARVNGRTEILMWDKSVLIGELADGRIGFEITPGAILRVDVLHCLSLVRAYALPPGQVRRRVEKLIAKLGAESYKDREAAMKELNGIGSVIVPILRRHLNHHDPEVRQRLEDLIERLGGKASPPAPPRPSVVPHVRWGLRPS